MAAIAPAISGATGLGTRAEAVECLDASLTHREPLNILQLGNAMASNLQLPRQPLTGSSLPPPAPTFSHFFSHMPMGNQQTSSPSSLTQAPRHQC